MKGRKHTTIFSRSAGLSGAASPGRSSLAPSPGRRRHGTFRGGLRPDSVRVGVRVANGPRPSVGSLLRAANRRPAPLFILFLGRCGTPGSHRSCSCAAYPTRRHRDQRVPPSLPHASRRRGTAPDASPAATRCLPRCGNGRAARGRRECSRMRKTDSGGGNPSSTPGETDARPPCRPKERRRPSCRADRPPMPRSRSPHVDRGGQGTGGSFGRGATASPTDATWLILPVVICLSQRLSHACVSMN